LAGYSTNVAHLSKILGHTTITTTFNRYVKPLQGDLDDAVDVLDKAYEEVEGLDKAYISG
jgi:hypothetical protein